MSNILFAGDSLTAGTLGFSMLSELSSKQSMERHRLINGGENGFTMEGIRRKTIKALSSIPLPDVLVIEGGANDLLLPYMTAKGPQWDPFIRKLKRHGSVPASSSEEFENIAREFIDQSRDAGVARIIICTIPPLGEDLNSPLNVLRMERNQILRSLCGDEVNCADLAAAAEKALHPIQPGSSWLFSTPEELQEDARIVSEAGGAERLCASRGLLLTIDGSHPNARGAALLAGVLYDSLEQSGLDLLPVSGGNE